jgi:hypothetical protein
LLLFSSGVMNVLTAEAPRKGHQNEDLHESRTKRTTSSSTPDRKTLTRFPTPNDSQLQKSSPA